MVAVWETANYVDDNKLKAHVAHPNIVVHEAGNVFASIFWACFGHVLCDIRVSPKGEANCL